MDAKEIERGSKEGEKEKGRHSFYDFILENIPNENVSTYLDTMISISTHNSKINKT